MKKVQAGFTLIELLIVIAIIGILAAIAIPSYQDYTIRSQVSEGINLATAAQAAVAETYSSRGVAPPNRAGAGLSAPATDTQGRYVTQLDVVVGEVIVTYGNDRERRNPCRPDTGPHTAPDRRWEHCLAVWPCTAHGREPDGRQHEPRRHDSIPAASAACLPAVTPHRLTPRCAGPCQAPMPCDIRTLRVDYGHRNPTSRLR